MSSTRFNQFAPIFPVRDLGAAIDHYGMLGFTTRAYEQGDWYGFADRDAVGLHFSLHHEHDHADPAAPDHDDGHIHPPFAPAVAYLYVDDADALAAEWGRPGIGGTTGPVHDTPYGLREGVHVDPDGNEIRFGSPTLSG
jgi:catechol 2,3-dioxygenase-like lactoylglutathione lyase family enzyme